MDAIVKSHIEKQIERQQAELLSVVDETQRKELEATIFACEVALGLKEAPIPEQEISNEDVL